MDADLLVLDDLGTEKTSEWVEETMNLIVNTRYNERRHDDLHLELRRHPGRRRSRLAAGAHRLPHALAAARDVRVPRVSTAPTIASCRPTAASTTCSRCGRCAAGACCRAARKGQSRAQLSSRAGRPGRSWSGPAAKPGPSSSHLSTSQPRSSGLYLHIPFCSSICNYCNFNRGLFDAALKTRYVAGPATRRSRRCRRAGDAPPTRSSSAAGRRRCWSRPRSPRLDRARAAMRSTSRPTPRSRSKPIPRRSTPNGWNGSAPPVSIASASACSRSRTTELKRLGRIHSADRARARRARGARRRVRQRQPRPDDVAAGADARATGWRTSRRSSRPRPITRRCTCSSSIRTRR